MNLAHLARRFVGSLRPGGPSTADVAWVEQHLLPGELVLWRAMPGPDRRHSAGVARRVATTLGAQVARPVVAAALLHDVGKTASGLRTPGRVAATLVGAAVGRDRAPGRIGRYLHHDQDGARLLEEAGSDPLTVAWAREHHLPESAWSIPTAVGRALRDADDD